MAKSYGEISNEAKAIFSDVITVHKKSLDRFYSGFARALDDIDKRWKRDDFDHRERKNLFEKVRECACKLIVDKSQRGGEADNGLSRGTFDGYVCTIKRALLYHVSLDIAENATHQKLQRAWKHVEEDMQNIAGTREQKMIQAVAWVEADDIKQKDRLKEEAEKRNKGKKISTESSFTLPSPDDYEDKDTDLLLEKGIDVILAWFQNKAMQAHLKKPFESAKLLKQIFGELLVHENSKEEVEKAVA